MLVQDDDFGEAYEEGFKQPIEGTDITVAEVEKYAAGADEVDVPGHQPRRHRRRRLLQRRHPPGLPQRPQRGQGRRTGTPITFVSGTCISKTLMGIAGDAADGVLATTNIKDPLNPAFADDEAMKEYKATLEEFGADDVDPENGIVAYGYTQAALLRADPREPRRRSTAATLMNKMYDLEGHRPAACCSTASRSTPARGPVPGRGRAADPVRRGQQVLRRTSARSSTSRARPPTSRPRT